MNLHRTQVCLKVEGRATPSRSSVTLSSYRATVPVPGINHVLLNLASSAGKGRAHSSCSKDVATEQYCAVVQYV